jgi:hypothetical protein
VGFADAGTSRDGHYVGAGWYVSGNQVLEKFLFVGIKFFAGRNQLIA